MPLLNFIKEHAEDVLTEKKRCTIRAYRKDGRDPTVGDTLYLYTGLRTKNCEKLGEAICESTDPIEIRSYYSLMLGKNKIVFTSFPELAQADGFDSQSDFIDFFKKHHGLPFNGLLIKWGELIDANE